MLRQPRRAVVQSRDRSGGLQYDAPPMVRIGPRIAIYGPSGAGKSTLARQLGERLELPVVELDAIFHAHPNWVDLERDEFRAAIEAVLARHPDGWVIDGNYTDVRDLILARAETVVWLRLPFTTVCRRLVWRTVSRAVRGAELWNGNRESLRQTFLTRDSMLIWGLKSARSTPRKIAEALVTVPHGARVYELRSPRAVRRFSDAAVLAAPLAESA